MPIHLMVEERAEVHRRKREDQSTNPHTINKETRAAITMKWQQIWDASTKGRWTHRLIPDIIAWTTRKHGEVDYYLVQLLTGHGGFRAYQHRFRLHDAASCPVCQTAQEDAEHAFFHCPRFKEERETLQPHLRQQLSCERIIGEMMALETTWNAVSDFSAAIIRNLRKAVHNYNFQNNLIKYKLSDISRKNSFWLK